MERSDDAPAWLYYHSPGFFDLQSGLAQRYLGRETSDRNARAIELLTIGLDALDELERASEWAADYVYQLALAYLQASVPDLAGEAAADTARATGSTSLTTPLNSLHTHWPSQRATTELGHHLHPD